MSKLTFDSLNMCYKHDEIYIWSNVLHVQYDPKDAEEIKTYNSKNIDNIESKKFRQDAVFHKHRRIF